ncbi:MAG TPA: hypothetical protein VK355_01860 [Candidatus Binatia bacterium]|jgi:hypothetical protein|nr:hypothetical protein [Candidatus Binatia bacterium]
MTAMTRRDETLRIEDSVVRQCRESVNNQQDSRLDELKKHVWDMSGRTYLRPKTARSQNTAPNNMGPPLNINRACSWGEFQMRVVGTVVERLSGVGVLLSVNLNRREPRLLKCAAIAKVCKRTALSTFLRRESICKQQIVPNLGGERCASERARNATMYEKLIMVTSILAALCVTGLISIMALWLITAGDPLVMLASAPF